jgi:hypothetical protein
MDSFAIKSKRDEFKVIEEEASPLIRPKSAQRSGRPSGWLRAPRAGSVGIMTKGDTTASSRSSVYSQESRRSTSLYYLRGSSYNNPLDNERAVVSTAAKGKRGVGKIVVTGGGIAGGPV